MTALLAFLLGLPLAVQTYGTLLRLLDRPDRTPVLMSLCLWLGCVTLLVLVAGSDARAWVGYAFVLVAVLHTTVHVVVRGRLRGGKWVARKID